MAQGTSLANDLLINNELVHYAVGIVEEAVVGGSDGQTRNRRNAAISEEER